LATITSHLIGAIQPAHFSSSIRTAILSTILPAIGLSILTTVLSPISLPVFTAVLLAIFLSNITGLGHPEIVAPATSAITATAAIRRPWSTVGRTGPAIVAATASSPIIWGIPAPVIDRLKTEPVKLPLQTHPLRFSERRCVEAFDPRPYLPFFAADSGTKIVIPESHVPLRATSRRNDGRHLAKDVLIRITVQEQRPLLCIREGKTAELHFLHARPRELRLSYLLHGFDINRPAGCSRQSPVNLDLPVLNRWRRLRPQGTGHTHHSHQCPPHDRHPSLLVHVRPSCADDTRVTNPASPPHSAILDVAHRIS
jgi:hypothetical protein